MRSVFFLAIFAALGLTPSTVPVRAAPHLQARAPMDDVAVFNYALTLEYLESAFYDGALARFDERAFADAGLSPGARARFVEVAAHEQAHVQLLRDVLKDKAVRPCEYFFPYSDPRSFAALSQILEGVGVSAYIGATAFITSKGYLTVAASILSTEARHASYVQATVNGLAPWSGSFDTPLPMNTVYALARLFITSCPDANSMLRVPRLPALTVVTPNPKPGSKATLDFDAPASGGALWLALYSGLDKAFVSINEGREVVIPDGLRGTVYGVVSRSANSTRDEDVVAGVAVLRFD